MAVSNLHGALMALLAFGVFATHDILVKELGATYAPPQVVFFSVLMSFPLLTMLLIRQKRATSLRPRFPIWVLVRSVAIVINALSVFYAFSVLPLAQTYAVLFATPLLITLLAIPILGERVGIHRGAAVLLGLIGVLVVLRPGSADLELGHAAAVLAACGGAFASVIVRKIGKEEHSAVLLAYPMLINILAMGAMLPWVYQPMPLADLGLAAGVAVLSFSAMICMITAYRLGEAAVVAPMQYSQLIWALFYGSMFFDEQVDTMTLIGAGLIIASGVYIVWRESRGGKVSENMPVIRARGRPDTGTAPRLPRDIQLPQNDEEN